MPYATPRASNGSNLCRFARGIIREPTNRGASRATAVGQDRRPFALQARAQAAKAALLARSETTLTLWRVDVDRVMDMKAGPERTAALVAWLQSCFESPDVPVLVGGAAVELYTGGAHTTGDLDFVGRVPATVARQLESAGFERRGRHWIHDRAQLFLAFPNPQLGEGERSTWVRVHGFRVRVVSIEDLLVDRLVAWQQWTSPVDGINAFHLFRAQRRRVDPRRLTQQAKSAGIADALQSLRTFVKRWKGRVPPAEELETWSTSTGRHRG